MANMTRFSLLASLVVVAACSGCRQLNVWEIDGNSFAGIKEAVDRSDVVSILIVHGMGGYSTPDPQQIIDTTVSKLSLCSQGEPICCPIYRPNSDQRLGYLLRQDFTQMHTYKQVRIYTLQWSDATKGVKQQYVGYDNIKTNNPHRLSLNHRFKRDLVNHNLSDVVLYLGEYGDTMLIPFKKSILVIDRDVPQGDDYELILISFSLGSIMLLDAVEALVQDELCKISERFCNSVSTFFMLANQVPLLLMGDYQVQDDDIETQAQYQLEGSLKGFLDVRLKPLKDPHEMRRKFNIVAISDPNDLLSYTIPDWLAKKYPDTFVNVTASVARSSLWIPFVGEVANPMTAHRGYGRDKRVLDVIVNGYHK